ncbi:hypothetical protein D3C83_223100 [compost metagenome]
MAVMIQDFEAVQDDGQGGADGGGKAKAPGPVAHAALDRLLVGRRQRLMRLWAN